MIGHVGVVLAVIGYFTEVTTPGTGLLLARDTGVSGAWLRQKYKPTLKVRLYFRRRQALWHAFIRLSNAYESVSGVSVYTFHARHQRASTRERKRSSAQDATKFNSVEFSRFTPRTPAIQPTMYRCHELSLQRIELAITSVNSLVTKQLGPSCKGQCDFHINLMWMLQREPPVFKNTTLEILVQ